MRAKIKAVVPIWSQYITVVRQADDALLISGDGYIPSPFSTEGTLPQEFLQLDFTHKMRRYILRRLGRSRGNAELDGPDGVYQFANATTDEKLIAFVEEFGPIHGKVVEAKPVAIDDDSWEVTVRETLRSLRREQKQFRRLVETIRLLKRNARAERATLLDLLTALAADRPMKLLCDWTDLDWIEVLENVQRQHLNPSKEILSVAHQMVCYFLSQHPPGLLHVAGGVVELPRIKITGIRDALYFQLRLDYLAQRTIATCLHCHEHFAVYRRGTPACGESCSRALRNARYWDSNKETINASRREKPPKEESRKSKVSGRALRRKTSQVNRSKEKGEVAMAVYQHKNSRVYTMEFIVNGQRIRESTGMTSITRAKEVEYKRKQGLKDGIAGIRKRKLPGLLSIAAEEYLAKKKGTKNTLRIERTNLDHLLPELGRKLVCDIEVVDVARYQQKRLDQGAAPKTINLEIGTLRQILKRGGQWARLQIDEDKVDMLEAEDDVGRDITPREEAALLKACAESRSRSLLTFVTLAIETGARYGVIRTLQWGNVDFAKGCLKWGKDKTPAGTGRIVPLTQRALAALNFWATEFPERRPKHYAFPTERYGDPGNGSALKAYNTDPSKPIGSVKAAWKEAKKRAGIEVRFHDLRHTAVSRMLNAGVPIPKVAKIVGWSTSTMVKMAAKYGHFSLDDLREAVEVISRKPDMAVAPEAAYRNDSTPAIQ